MLRTLFCISFATLLVAGDVAQPWKDKKIPEWTQDDAKLVISDSPWAKVVTPEIIRASSSTGARPGGMGRGGGVGRGGGIGIGGVGIGLPGSRRGGGYPGGGYPSGGGRRPGADREAQEPPKLTLRWASALPVREGELKAGDGNAPTIDENHYAIVVYGVPGRMASGDSKTLASGLKKKASLQRDGKKDLKPSDVQILRREDGPVIVYLFPRKTEITKSDRRVLFEAQIGRLQVSQPFFTEDMVYDGKVEL